MLMTTQDKHHSAPSEGDREVVGGGSTDELGDQELYEPLSNEGALITLSRDAYESSKNWFDSSIRAQQEKNLRAFNNEHPPGSKYHTEQYRKKSKIYRPKTRSFIRKQQAAAAVAFFSTSDVLHCSPVNDKDPAGRAAAELHMALANLRLDQRELYWYQTVIGAVTDAATAGVVCSKQDWKFNVRNDTVEEVYDAGDGVELSQMVEEETVLEDRPDVTLIPIENLHFSAASDWRDPINSSPYVIEQKAMFMTEILELQKRVNPVTGKPFYLPVNIGMLAAAIHQDWDSVRKAREGERLDKYDNDTMVRAHQSVWVHKHIMDINGQDYCWETLGTEILIRDIQPIEEVYLTGKRPYVWGNCNIEPHKQYPAGTPELIDGLQEETNDIANLRLDNVKLALNKRYYAKRGAGIDIRSLVRNVSGSVTFMNNPATDVKTIDTHDVTGSSYQEQDRLNMDMDDLLGDFGAGTVAGNRKLGETVGGMEMMNSEANQLKEFSIRTFAETWYEPVLRQIIELESVYETDEALLIVGADRAGLKTIEEALQVISKPIRVKVNVGFDSTNPQKRIGKLALGLDQIGKFAPHLLQQLDAGEFVAEIMGALGYRDGVRFFPSLGDDQQDPRIAQLEQQIQEMQQFIETKQAEQQGRIQVAQITQQGATARTQMQEEVKVMLSQNKNNMEAAIIQMKNRLEELDRMVNIELSDIKRREYYLQREALSAEIQERDRQYALQVAGMAKEGGEGGAVNLPGNDKAGVISRGQYGMVPNNAA